MAVLPEGARGCLHHPEREKVYFFAGKRYWRHDLSRDYGECLYPAPLEAWSLPGVFADGIDAAVEGFGFDFGKAFFFKDDQYLRYDWETNSVDGGPAPIAKWGLTMGAFASGVDVAFNGQGFYAGNTYFFKGDQYVRFNWEVNKIDVGPLPIATWNLGPGFERDIAACCNTSSNFGLQPKAHFFKGDRHVRYDWGSDRADSGYPLPTGAGWPSGLAVWAEHSSAPLRSCTDARLEGGENRRLAYPEGTPRGQAGWQLGLGFTNPANLADELEQAKIPAFYGDDVAGSGLIAAESVTRLALVAQGEPGSLDTAEADSASRLSSSTVESPPLRTALERIGEMLEPAAPVVLLGCNCARGAAGDGLLKALSQVWPGHPVSGFTRIAYADSGRQQRPAMPCNNPGLRVTEREEPFSSDPAVEQCEENQAFAPDWEDLTKLPWGHENLARHRKTALDGQIVH
jgi:hypothetical protein